MEKKNEEKKVEIGQVVKLGSYNNVEKSSEPKKSEKKGSTQKLSYEELEKVAQQLNGRCVQLEQQLLQAGNIIRNYNDVEMLLDIVKAGDTWFDDHFIRRCAWRIETLVGRMLDAVEEREEKESQAGQQ